MLESSLAAKAKSSRHALRERLAAQRWQTVLCSCVLMFSFTWPPTNNGVCGFSLRSRRREVAMWWMAIPVYRMVSSAVF